MICIGFFLRRLGVAELHRSADEVVLKFETKICAFRAVALGMSHAGRLMAILITFASSASWRSAYNSTTVVKDSS